MTAEQNFKWNKSKRGVCIRLWHHNVRNSIKRGHKPPEYSQKELIDWVLKQPNFELLYTNWKISNYKQDFAVSIDRLDDSKGYSFDNIQLVTFRENYLKSHQGFRDKTLYNPTLLNSGHTTIYQYDIYGNLLNTYISFSEASRVINKRHQLLSKVIKNRTYYAYGYLWCTDITKSDMLVNRLNFVPTFPDKFKSGKILKYNTDGKTLLAVYSSMIEASEEEKVSEHIIRCWIAGKPTRKQTKYIFIKEYNV